MGGRDLDLDGLRPGTPDCRRAGRLGADVVLAGLFLDQPPGAVPGLGPVDRAGDFAAELRVLRWERAAGGGAVEWRHQFRGRGRLCLRRPGHPADSRYLPEVLRRTDGHISARGDLRVTGPGVTRARAGLRG